jgi:L-seryl-tRNA(Ser) seleniumtransferase
MKEDIYKRLGLKRYINAYDTLTNYGGSRMSDEVLEAYKEAASYFVDMREFQIKAGERIAELTNNEAAYLTTGASMGVTLACAACMVSSDRYLNSRLPDTEGMKNEVIIMRSQRNPYDKAIEVSGAKLVEVGNLYTTEEFELEGAISEKTAAVYYIKATNYSKGAMPLEKVIEIAHRKGVYVIVDAAAQLPPKENLWKFTKMGADIVAFSGGKALKGPLNTGFIVGKKELIESCRMIGFPNRGIARGGKISREDIAALLIAVERYVEMDEEKYQEDMRKRAEYYVDQLEDSDLYSVRIEEIGPVGQLYPRAEISLKTDRFSVEELSEKLKEQEPGVLVGLPLQKPYDVFYINPLVMDDCEKETVLKLLIKAGKELNER